MNDQDLKKVRSIVKEELKEELKVSESRILKEVGDFVEDQILPAIDQLSSKIDGIGRRMDGLATEQGKHNLRITNIENLPTVAHELKTNKSS